MCTAQVEVDGVGEETLARDVFEERGDGEEGEVDDVRGRRDGGKPFAVAAQGGVPSSF